MEGARLRNGLFGTTPGLERLVEDVKDEYRSNGGWLKTIDGGYVRCNSPHAAINYKFQSAGGLVMKQTSIFLDKHLREEGLDCLKVGDIHDEGQIDSKPSDAERCGTLAVQSIKEAGEELNFNLPLTGNFKIGENWAMTH